jgi:spermidine synthase
MAYAGLLILVPLSGRGSAGLFLLRSPEPYFAALCLAGGFLTGFQFPLAGRLHLGRSSGAGGTGGLLNGLELLGGFTGGLLGGVYLLPVLGVTGCCVVVVLIKCATCSLLLLAFLRTGKGIRPEAGGQRTR